MNGLAWLARRRLDEASSRGEFNEFEGKGKPFRPSLFGNPHEGEWEMAFHIMRQAEVAPRWIELDKEICRRRGQFRRWFRTAASESEGEAGFRVFAQARRELDALNEQIRTRNLLAPTSIRPLFQSRLDREIELARGATMNQKADHDGRLGHEDSLD